jgi:hypothetical protein
MPNVPVTNGLPSGPGSPTPPATISPQQDLVAAMAKHLPYLQFAAQRPDTPQSVKAFVNYLQAQLAGGT